MALSRPFISILFSTSTERPAIAVARPGNWSKRQMAGGLRPSSTLQSHPCGNRDWRQDPMLDVFETDDRRAEHCFYLAVRQPAMRISTSLLALCCQSPPEFT